MAFVRPRVGTVPFGATADTCAETAECRVPTAVHVQRGVQTANLQTDFLFRGRDVVLTMNSVKILHAVRSAITATAELLVNIKCL